MELNLILAAMATYVLNLPFGYVRQGFKKFSVMWFVAIHAPIPFVVLFRHLFGLGFELYTYPIMVSAFFLGQFTGKKARIYLDNRRVIEDVEIYDTKKDRN
ncbi:hypothetical protein [Marinifilum sp. D737]|uniref:hypothetical protein n=1 Tax=Marinifilum sp. D737 TaxID=2969628 RepID=UPI0022747236|nr:hypothetical protein [Marinifilum sp. D737]MCY1632805.1 hypothetical protein [Marinifilum sp. D737]